MTTRQHTTNNRRKKIILLIAPLLIVTSLFLLIKYFPRNRQITAKEHIEFAHDAFGRADYSKAEEEFNAALAKDETKETWQEIAFIYQLELKKTEAISAYERAIELGVNDAATYNNLANLYRDILDYSKSEEYYKQAITHIYILTS